MNAKLKVVIASVIVGMVTVGMVGLVYALQCYAFYEIDEWDLELVDVSVDGASIEDLEEYDDSSLELTSTPPEIGSEEDAVTLFVEKRDEDGYDLKQLKFDRGTLPPEMESHSSGEVE